MNTESVTLTITSKDGFFQAKVEKNGYFNLDVTKIMKRAMRLEAICFTHHPVLNASVEAKAAESEDESEEEAEAVKPTSVRHVARKLPGCRDPKRCFVNGQKIRHKCRGGQGWWTGVFHDGGIWHKEDFFEADDSISQFARAHYYSAGVNPSSPPPVYSYWDECECEVDGQWISTYNLRPLI